MSQEEYVELKDLVTEALEKNGVLAKIRAQLRANIFMALESENDQKHHNPHLKDSLSSHDGVLSLLLVQELLEFCDLRQTCSIYKAETGQGKTYFYEGRQALIRNLEFTRVEDKCNSPVLVQLVKVLYKLLKTSQLDNLGGVSTGNAIDSSNDKSFNESETSPRVGTQNSTFVVNSGRSDIYNLSFASDSESSIASEDKSHISLHLNLNNSTDTNHSSSKELDGTDSPHDSSDSSKHSNIEQESLKNKNDIGDSAKSVTSEIESNQDSKEISLSFGDLSPKSDAIEDTVKGFNDKEILLNNFESNLTRPSNSQTFSSLHHSNNVSKRNGSNVNDNKILQSLTDTYVNATHQTVPVKNASNHQSSHNSGSNRSSDSSSDSISEEIMSVDTRSNNSIQDEILQTITSNDEEQHSRSPEKLVKYNTFGSPPPNLLDQSLQESPTTKLRVKEQISSLKHQNLWIKEDAGNNTAKKLNSDYNRHSEKDFQAKRLVNTETNNEKHNIADNKIRLKPSKVADSQDVGFKTPLSSLVDLPALVVNKNVKILPSYKSSPDKIAAGISKSLLVDGINSLDHSTTKDWTDS